jgi:hypothetical protein
VAIGDVTNDGLPDLLIANSGTNNVYVLVNKTPTLKASPAQVVFYASQGNRPRLEFRWL